MSHRRLFRAGLAAVAAAVLALPLTIAGATAVDRGRAYTVTATPGGTQVTLGQPVQVTGTVRPAAAGKPVTVQELSGKKWRKIATATLDSGSAYSVDVKPTRVGNRKLRVCKAAQGRTAQGCSPAFVVSVFQWRYLYDASPVDYDGIYSEDPLSINGGTFKKSLVSDSDSGTFFREYNISRRCTQFRATVGIADDSETGASGLVEILVDGNSLYSGQFALGQSAPVNLDVTDGLRIRFETTTDQDGLEEYVGFGSPQVYCSQ